MQQLCADRDVTLKTRRKKWTIGRGGERVSGISVLMAQHDDDDELTLGLLSGQDYVILFYLKILDNLRVFFSRRDSRLFIYHFVVWSNLISCTIPSGLPFPPTHA